MEQAFFIMDNIPEDSESVPGIVFGKDRAEEMVISLNKNHHGSDVYDKADAGNEPNCWRYGYEPINELDPKIILEIITAVIKS